MKGKYEYCITVPRTFVHYCSFDRAVPYQPDLGLNSTKILIGVQKQVKSNGNHLCSNRCMAYAKRGCRGRKDLLPF